MTITVKLTEAEIRAAIAEWVDNNSNYIQNTSDSCAVTLTRDPSTGEFMASVECVERTLP